MPKLSFVVLGKPAPQGSMRGIVRKDGKVFMKSDNPQTRPFRQEVGWTALNARAAAGYHEIMFAKHVPVWVTCSFFFAPPKASRKLPSVKPDLDKLCRAVFDSIKGVIYVDDGQVVNQLAKKRYGLPERAEITIESVE